jgi:hypothetical protein
MRVGIVRLGFEGARLQPSRIARKTRVETGLARLSPLHKSGLALDFGWRSASALQKDLTLLHEREGHGFKSLP